MSDKTKEEGNKESFGAAFLNEAADNDPRWW
jgi:hypothetical protein